MGASACIEQSLKSLRGAWRVKMSAHCVLQQSHLSLSSSFSLSFSHLRQADLVHQVVVQPPHPPKQTPFLSPAAR